MHQEKIKPGENRAESGAFRLRFSRWWIAYACVVLLGGGILWFATAKPVEWAWLTGYEERVKAAGRRARLAELIHRESVLNL